MTTRDLVESLNQTAASLLVLAERHPTKVNEMRCLAVRLQIMAMDLGDNAAPEAPAPRLRLFN